MSPREEMVERVAGVMATEYGPHWNTHAWRNAVEEIIKIVSEFLPDQATIEAAALERAAKVAEAIGGEAVSGAEKLPRAEILALGWGWKVHENNACIRTAAAIRALKPEPSP